MSKAKYVDPTTGKPPYYKEPEKEEKKKKVKLTPRGKYVDPTTGKPPYYKEPEKEEKKKKVKLTPRGKYVDPTTGKPPDEAPEKTDLEKAKEAIKTAESYKQAVGSTIQWGEQTYDLGTTQGWKDYQQAVREAKSELSAYERSLQKYRFAAISSQAPEPATAQLGSGPTSVGPPQTASAEMVERLRAEGYELPPDKTIYISPSGEVYYYEEEPAEPRKTLSMHLWEASKRFEEFDTAKLFGLVPYSEKGARQIGAVLAGSAERTATSLFGFVFGEQPLEIMPDEQSFDWRGLGFDDLPKGKLFAARTTGIVSEEFLSFGVYAAAGYGAGAVIGASGALVSRAPRAGPALEWGGAKLSALLSTRAGQAALTLPIVAIEGKRVLDLTSTGMPRWEVAAEVGIEASKLFGFAYGLSRGLSYGKQLPTKLEQIITRGKVIPEEAFVPKYVQEGGDFPKFSEEPFKPTAKGYREMAEHYTPPELRITEEMVPSYHAAPGRMEGVTPEGFITQVGKRPGEAGMFFAPAGSKHFLRLDGGYSLRPGFPNLFSESQWVYGEFPGVIETGLGKTSPELAAILEKSVGTGKLYMPTGQLGEAQAILGPGTEMVSVPGRYYADIGGKTVKIGRYLPRDMAKLLGLEAPGVSVESLMSKSSLFGEQPTTYLPILSSTPSKAYEPSVIDRVTVSKTSKPSETKLRVSEPTVKSDLSITTPSVVSVTSVTEPSGAPSRGSPSRVTPEPSPTSSDTTKITGITSTPSRGTPSKTPPIYTPMVTRRPPSKTTYKQPDLFGKKKQRSVQAVDVFGSRGYKYKVIEPVDILGTGKRRKGKAPQINVFGEKKKEIPNIFGPSKKKRSVKIF